jgi:hypothetical protein
MSRIEKGILDRIINKTLLGKRKIGAPFKYNVEPAYELSR